MKETLTPKVLLALLAMTVLLASCTLPAAPDVTPTPSGAAAVMDSGMADLEATANYEATVAAEVSPVETPSPEPTVELTTIATSPPDEATPAVAATVQPTTIIPTIVIPTQEAALTLEPAVGTTDAQDYIVQPGDTLYSIARRYNMRFEDLAAHNGIVNPHQIWVGQVIHIPAGGTVTPPSGGDILYTVRVGDNLFRIALRYNISYIYLASYNGISNPHLIRVGQTIHIPSAQ